MSIKRMYFMLGLTVLAVGLVVAGVVLILGGTHAADEVKDALVSERIEVADPRALLTYPNARAPEGVVVPMVVVDDSQ